MATTPQVVPSYREDRYDPQKVVIGEMTNQDVVNFVNGQAEEYRQRMSPFRAIQDRLWQLYRNQEDFSDKEDWQSRVAFPKAPSAVKLARANIIKLLFSNDQWLAVEGQGVEELLTDVVRISTENLLRSKAFMLRSAFEQALDSALACCLGIVKVYPRNMSLYPGETSGRMTISARAVDYRKFFFGPYTTHESVDYCGEDFSLSYAELQASGKFNDVLGRIERDAWQPPSEEQAKDAERFDRSYDAWGKYNARLANTGVREYWGPIVDPKKQKLLMRDAHVLIFNRNILAMLKPNELEFRKPPYALFSPLRVAFRFPGEGILETSRELFRAVNRVANMKIDGLQFSEQKQFEVDMSLLENPMDIATGVEPGKIYRKRQGTGLTQAIREVQVSDQKIGGVEVLGELDREIQRGTFVVDALAGLQTQASGQETATEYQSRLGNSSTLLLNMAEDIEDQGFSKVADLAFREAVQFLDSSTYPNWSLLLGSPSPLDQWDAKTRAQVVGWQYEFQFYGLSDAIRRSERIGNIMKTLEIVGANGIFPFLVNLPELFRDLLRAMGTGQYVVPNVDQVYQMILKQQMEAQQQANKTQQMTEQFQARNQIAMQRDTYKNELNKDMASFQAGLKTATQPQGDKTQ